MMMRQQNKSHQKLYDLIVYNDDDDDGDNDESW